MSGPPLPVQTSRVPDAKDGLLAALATRANLATVQRSFTHPGKSIAAEAIYFDDATSAQRDGAIGQRTRIETFDVVVVVSLIARGADPAAAERRLWAVVAEVETAVALDRTLGGEVFVASVRGIDSHVVREPQRIVSEALVTVECQARL